MPWVGYCQMCFAKDNAPNCIFVIDCLIDNNKKYLQFPDLKESELLSKEAIVPPTLNIYFENCYHLFV